MSDHINGGDSQRITREYFDSLLVEMRHIDAVEPSLSLDLYGETFDTPIMLAALSHLNNVHPDGLVEAARGMKVAGGVMWAGMGDPEELEAITDTGARTIKIIKPYADKEEIFRRIRHAESCGALAVGMDVDHQFGSINARYTVLDLAMRPQTMTDIREYVQSTKLPFIIKGVLSEQDAAKCLEAGVQGIVVSHHHGMVDYSLPPLQVLPKIVKLVAGRMPIFVDCGVERGLDVFKALALGATAVSVGRALMEPLRKSGADGVQQTIDRMNNELSWAMSVTCSADIRSIDPTVLWKK